MDSHRSQRVSEALREELGEMISYELSDPRVGEATITEVLVSPDMRHAQIRLHILKGSSSDKGSSNDGETIQALNHARPFLRRKLAERLNLFRIPELHFEEDVKTEGKDKMHHLLKRIRRGRPRASAGLDPAPPIESETSTDLGADRESVALRDFSKDALPQPAEPEPDLKPNTAE